MSSALKDRKELEILCKKAWGGVLQVSAKILRWEGDGMLEALVERLVCQNTEKENYSSTK